jgi:hypothetical protein
MEGSKKGMYCREHAQPGMRDVISKRCEHDGCKKASSFNLEGTKRPMYCREHAQPGMRDVISKRCEHEGCNKHPSFNLEGSKRPMYCREHAQPGMIDVVSKRCITDWCNTIVTRTKYKGFCRLCFMRVYPDEPVSRNYKIKEMHVVTRVKERFPAVTWICDKRYDFAPMDCASLRRPDMYCHLGSHVLIVEIDENQHKEYDTTCDNKRLCDLYQDFGHTPIVFVRFNPDDYKDSDGQKVSSCFGYDKYGVCRIKKSKVKELEYRLDVMFEVIERCMRNSIQKAITQKHLFFDSSSETQIHLKNDLFRQTCMKS